ncbi:MAG: ABC transporter ATP-binding protein/permease [Oscillospiraceae bacterium]|jgi:ATP-binding cassette subfamily B protein|nr:ABC transporter ATP-binding protein/permease [Oscillospiraceae bacterium]
MKTEENRQGQEKSQKKAQKKTFKQRLISAKESFKNLGFLLSLYRKYALAYLIITVSLWAFWGMANSLISVYISRVVVGKIEAKSPYLAIIAAAGLLYGLSALLSIMTNALSYLYQYPRNGLILRKVNREIFVKAMNTDYKYYDSPEFYNDFTWVSSNLGNQMEQSRNILENLVQSFTTFVAMTAYLSVVGPWVLAVTAAGVLVRGVLQYKSISLDYSLSDKLNPHQRTMTYINRMFYTKEPAADIKTTRVRDYLLRTYDKASDTMYKTHLSANVKMFLLDAMSSLANQIVTVCVIALIVKSVIAGETADIALYTSLLIASQQMNSAMWSVSYQLTQLGRVSKYTNRIRKFFETESVIEITDGVGADIPDCPLSVDFTDVTFAYGEVDAEVERLNEKFGKSEASPWEKTRSEDDPKEHKPVIERFDMHVKAGEKIAIVGENGAGKTTLTKLLLRLYDVSGGELMLGGRDIKEYDARKLRDAVGIAFQQGQTFALPLSENLRIYRDADDEELRDILRKVGLSKLLENKKGLDAQVTREFDDGGIMLSGGEMQKFALARLLTGRFGLLILDEPTASLDPLAEYELNKMILDRSRPETTIVIAHRLSTIRDADRIYLVDGGRVAECGSHDELIALGGKYAEMFTKQAEKYVE